MVPPPVTLAASQQPSQPQPARSPDRPQPRVVVEPVEVGAVLRLERELGVSHPVAQILCRRGLDTPEAARAFLAADERHPAAALEGIDEAAAAVLRHVQAGSRITVHGDYDVDGVCSTAVLVTTLRELGATVDWFIPSRTEDGYGLSRATVERLAARGTGLLLTADCAITAVAEVAAARAAGMDVVVTDHHAPRSDGVLPDAPIVHPALGAYPCPDLCAAGVAHKLSAALLEAAGRDPASADRDLDLVALATVADVVPLLGENRRLVREGLQALAATSRPGLRALMRVARADPSRLDARAVAFRLAPRLNAAGRLYRADAALELLLTQDAERAATVADELDRANAERRQAEERIRFAAEAQVAEQGDRPAYVVAAEGWHPGIVGIVASRIAERHHRPAIVVALDGETGTGSGRSIPGYDLLAGLDAAAEHLLRHGGHRAAAGLELRRDRLDAFREALCEHADAALTDELRRPVERVDAVVAGDELGLALAEELERLGPFGQGNPEPTLLLPAARLCDPQAMGEGRHVRFTLESGGVRARAVRFGEGSALPCPGDAPADVAVRLERNEWNGSVEPRLQVRLAHPCRPGHITLVGEPGDIWAALALADALAARDAGAWPPAAIEPAQVRDRRGGGIAGIVAALVASGEPVLVACADAPRRLHHLRDRLGGFALCSHAALEADPSLAGAYAHLVVLDPAPYAHLAAAPAEVVHLAWGEQETRFAEAAHEAAWGLRAPLRDVYRALRDGAAASALAAHGHDPAVAARCLRVLEELGLLAIDRGGRTMEVLPVAQRTAVEHSATFRVCEQRRLDGLRFLSSLTTPRAA